MQQDVRGRVQQDPHVDIVEHSLHIYHRLCKRFIVVKVLSTLLCFFH